MMSLFEDHAFSGELTGLWFVSWYLRFGLSAWYLHSAPIKAAFNRLETLGLTSNWQNLCVLLSSAVNLSSCYSHSQLKQLTGRRGLGG
jgi:hypothetical protein